MIFKTLKKVINKVKREGVISTTRLVCFRILLKRRLYFTTVDSKNITRIPSR